MADYQTIYNVQVSNCGPYTAKILAIGEAPGEDEEISGIPFSGPAGVLFEQTLNRHGLEKSEIYLANLSNFRPRGNKFFHLYGSKQLQDGKKYITDILATFRPNVIVPMGNEALEFIAGRKSITKWRGSIIESQSSINSIHKFKVIPTFHPSHVLRNQDNLPTFDMDWARIASDSTFPDLRYTEREYRINPQGMELELLTEELCNSSTLAIDIESTRDGDKKIICIGFAASKHKGITIFLESQHQRSCAQRILLCRARKIFHFGIFDRCKLLDEGFEIEGSYADTFVGQETLNAGLPNGLDYLTSIYTREPYYKSEGRAEIPDDTKVWASTTDKSKLGIYNCKDVVCTFEIDEGQQKELSLDKLWHIYDNQLEQIEMAIDISREGFEVDVERKELFRKALYNKWSKFQWALNTLGKSTDKTGINVQSPKLKKFLYTDLGLPEKKKRDPKTGEWKVTTDDDALVSLIAFTKNKVNESIRPSTIAEWEKKYSIVTLIHRIRGIRKLLSSYIEVKISTDNRIRSLYSVAGTETGRWACYKYLDDTGVNAQTFYRGTIEIPDDVGIPIDISKMFEELKKEKENDGGEQQEAA